MIKVVAPDDDPAVANGGEPLRNLCHQEAANFDRYLREEVGGEYAAGLAKFEWLAIEGYLYQKIRGRLESQDL
jgi:hypothetical protein